MIPASAVAKVTPSVLVAGGAAVALNGLILTQSNRVPIGSVQQFTSASAVSALFGPNAAETNYANIYFLGPDDAKATPGLLLMAQYPAAPVPAYTRGASLAGLTLAQLQALSGSLTITIDGHPFTAASINLSAAVSYSNAAAIIATALAATDAVVTAAIAATTMTVSAVASGALAIGQVISGTGVTAGTTITALGTGTGGVGTYTVSASQTVSSTTITAGPAVVSYDSVTSAFMIQGGTPGAAGSIGYATGTLATSLFLTQATGAVISQGADAATPAAAMTAIAAITQNWASFSTVWKPSLSDMLLFAAWNSAQKSRFAYIAYDNDITATAGAAPSSFGGQVQTSAYGGVVPIYSPTDGGYAPFIQGYMACQNFGLTDGRTVAKFRSQAGLTPAVTDQTKAANLESNGYNYYGGYDLPNGAGSDAFFAPGSVSGIYKWLDSFLCQVWLSSGLQAAMYTLLRTVGRIPYNPAGYGMVEAALAAPIKAAVNFGAITKGVTLSPLQVAEVNAAAGGRNIAPTLSAAGWYLLVLDADATVRAARGSPPCTLFYMDGQSVQTLSLASIAGQ